MPSQLLIVAAPEIAEVGKLLPVQPRVVIADSKGRAVDEVSALVELLVPPALQISGEQAAAVNGVAQFANTVLSGPVGVYTVEVMATVNGRGISSAFAVELRPGSGQAVELVSGGGQVAEVGSLLEEPIVLRVTDESGNRVPDQVLALESPSLGADVDAQVLTDEHGTAEVRSWRLGTRAGPQGLAVRLRDSVVLVVSGVAMAGPADTMVIVQSLHGRVRSRATVDSIFSVAVRDRYGNAVDSIPVTFRHEFGAISTLRTDSTGRAKLVGWRAPVEEGSLRVVAELLDAPTVNSVETALWVMPHFLHVSVGGSTSCASSMARNVYCWDYPVASAESPEYTPSPVSPERRLKGVRVRVDGAQQLAASLGAVCAVSEVGELLCEGNNRNSTFGPAAPAITSSAVRVHPQHEFLAVSLARRLGGGCGITSEQEVLCWDDGTAGAAIEIAGLTGVSYVSATKNAFTDRCAIANSNLWCWTLNPRQLGTSAFLDTVPTVVAPGVHYTVEVEGYSQLCTLSAAHGPLCLPESRDPAVVAAESGADWPSDAYWTFVRAGYDFACASGTLGVFCWGWNADGQLGRGTSAASMLPPALVLGLAPPVDLSLGTYHGCAVTHEGAVVCWGWHHGSIPNEIVVPDAQLP